MGFFKGLKLCSSRCRLLLGKFTKVLGFRVCPDVFMSSVHKHDPTAVEEAQEELVY